MHPQVASVKAQVTIILDDVGAKHADRAAFDLPREVTFSILPHTHLSTDFSYIAAGQNREVMLHMPMESLNGEALGEGPLLATMYPQELQHALLSALATVPHAVGVNNHMGSKLTQMTLPMQSIMQELAQNNMFFIDSRTTKYTKAGKIASQFGIATATRHVFLDHEQNHPFIKKQFQRLIYKARKNGKAIGIAHPYSVTLAFLQEALANLPPDIEIVTVSEYLQETNKFRVNPLIARASQSDPLAKLQATVASMHQSQQTGDKKLSSSKVHSLQSGAPD